MADNNSDAGEVIMIDQIPFHMVQPTEKLKKIFAHYLPLLKETLGEDLVSLHPIGSASIPGMPGSASIDIILRMKNFPPTEDQLAKLTSINFENRGKAPHTENDLMFQNYGKRFDCDEPIKRHHYGQVVLHFLSHENEWPKNPIAYAEYLKMHEEAFNKYRDVKIQGAQLQSDKTPEGDDKMELFRKYKAHKSKVALDLTEIAVKWAYVDGNLSLPF